MAAAAATAKDVVMELGGKSPAVVLPDADAELACRGTLFSSMMHSGQACVATTRMLVPQSRYAEFCEVLEGLPRRSCSARLTTADRRRSGGQCPPA